MPMVRLVGTTRSDRLIGTAGDDVIFTRGGDDRVRGLEGNDTIVVPTATGPGIFWPDPQMIISGGAGFDTLKIMASSGPSGVSMGWSSFRSIEALFLGRDTTLSLSSSAFGSAKLKLNAEVTARDAGLNVFLDVGHSNLNLSRLQIEGRLQIGLSGSHEDNRLVGNNRSRDQLEGDGGNDTLIGHGAADTLFGGDGNDRLFGGRGADSLNGGADDDVMTRGAGRDTFVFERFGVFADELGDDVITDFDLVGPVMDRILLRTPGEIENFADLRANHLTDTGAGALITYGQSTLLLAGIEADDLQREHFLIVPS